MIVYLSIGSNIEDRYRNIEEALKKLKQLNNIKILRVSKIYETEPVEKLDQPDFLNVAVEIETDIGPLELLGKLKKIESEMGRIPGERWGPRVIDIDIIFYGDIQYHDEQLTIPHKQYRTRSFVLVPLSELCGQKRDPITGKTVEQMRDSPTARGKVNKTDLLITP